VTSPNTDTQYNVHMGGVDLADIMVALLYPCKIPSVVHEFVFADG